ncbi:class I SAM-dependent methyltransferase [Leucothrix mucor]|uniref:class I SAM-dependent methyltransferase n=1 Tax=Leucothrix mucor TaxID=45248 RepID=UPI0003B448F5|nr:class I SAM-dependent methyltransferase [Leucothrix mucor]
MSDQHNSMQAFAEIWDVQTRELWDENYAQALADLFNFYSIKTILDCAGGTGFPTLEFKRQGLNVSYSDGSPEMLAFFNAKRFAEKLTIPTYLSSWQTLPERVPYTYDAVLCRGNSLMDLAVYSDEAPISRASFLSAMSESLAGMFSKVAEDGLLYIDIPKPEKVMPAKPSINSDTDSMTFKSKTTVAYDPETQISTTTELTTNLLRNTQSTSVAKAYAIDEEELIELLLTVGFERVEKSPLKEASFIDAYMAFK